MKKTRYICFLFVSFILTNSFSLASDSTGLLDGIRKGIKILKNAKANNDLAESIDRQQRNIVFYFGWANTVIQIGRLLANENQIPNEVFEGSLSACENLRSLTRFPALFIDRKKTFLCFAIIQPVIVILKRYSDSKLKTLNSELNKYSLELNTHKKNKATLSLFNNAMKLSTFIAEKKLQENTLKGATLTIDQLRDSLDTVRRLFLGEDIKKLSFIQEELEKNISDIEEKITEKNRCIKEEKDYNKKLYFIKKTSSILFSFYENIVFNKPSCIKDYIKLMSESFIMSSPELIEIYNSVS